MNKTNKNEGVSLSRPKRNQQVSPFCLCAGVTHRARATTDWDVRAALVLFSFLLLSGCYYEPKPDPILEMRERFPDNRIVLMTDKDSGIQYAIQHYGLDFYRITPTTINPIVEKK